MTARPAPRADARDLEEVLRSRRPAVVGGLLAGYEPLSLAELARDFGGHRVPVARVVDGVAYVAAEGVEYSEHPLADVVGSRDSLVSARPEDWVPGLTARLPALGPRVRASWRRARIWVSPGECVTPLHHEVTDNLLAQLEGDKSVTLYAPWERLAMYPQPPWSRVPHMSRVAAHAPDLDAFPRFARARAWRAHLEPGDVLFIPAFWWHWVRTHAPSLSYNLWFAGAAVAALARGMELYQRARSLSV